MHNRTETNIARKSMRSFLSALDRFRTDHDLSVDEAVIFMVIGDLNLSSRNSDVLLMRPTNMTAIAYQLDIPRETVRRKVKTLLAKGLVRARGREIYMDDIKPWLALGDQIRGIQPLRAVA